jgi:hypothetical protein
MDGLVLRHLRRRGMPPDAAVRQLEHMHSVLAQLEPDEREEFRRFAAQRAAGNAETSDRLTELATPNALCEGSLRRVFHLSGPEPTLVGATCRSRPRSQAKSGGRRMCSVVA